MSVNTNKTKTMIIKLKQVIYSDFVYNNSSLEGVHKIDFYHKLNWNYIVEK
jgi:hypothetical protein